MDDMNTALGGTLDEVGDKLNPRALFLFDIAKAELSIATVAETQRERFVFVVTAIAGFLVASMGWDSGVNVHDRWQAFFLVALGFVGVVQVMKLHTKKVHHFNRYRAFRDEVDRTDMGGVIKSLRTQGDAGFERDRPLVRFDLVPSQYLWTLIPLASLGIGVLVLIETR